MPATEGEPTIGFWFQHPPLIDATHEGICRAFGWVLKGLVEKRSPRLVVATPVWAQDMLLRLLQQHDIPRERIQIIVSRPRLPIFLKLVFWRMAVKAGQRPQLWTALDRAKRWVSKPFRTRRFQRLALRTLSTDSYPLSAAILLFVALAGLLLSPLIGLAALGALLTRKVLALWRKADPLSRLQARSGPLWLFLYNRMLEYEYQVLARTADRRRDVKVWYVAWPWAAEASKLKAPVIVSLWDFVCADFPTVFDAPKTLPTEHQFRRLLKRADAIATNSEYVRQRHAIGYFGIRPEVTHVVRISPNDYRNWLKTAQESGDSRQAAARTIREFVWSKRDDGVWNSKEMREYLVDFPFEEVPFLFNSTQIRPHKNTMNMLRAYEHVLRRKHANVKLVVTSRPHAFPESNRFISSRGLKWEVLPMPALPIDVHAAAYHLASLTVIPTLFEGGFPFPFQESLSVNTPAVMGRIPVTEELVSQRLASRMLFDPLNIHDIARKIHWALENRHELLDEQTAFFQQLNGRTSEHIAAEYGALLEKYATHRATSAAA